MKFLYLLFALVFLTLMTACSNSALEKKLSASDSLVITFNSPNSDSVIKTVSTTENIAINKIIDFMDAKSTEELKCGYDGNLVFYSKGEALLPVVFKYKDKNCRHFLFERDGKLQSTKISNEAADFLESLNTGKNYY